MQRRLIKQVAVGLAAVASCLATAAGAEVPPPVDKETVLLCGSIEPSPRAFDYRQRNSSEWYSGTLADNNRYHTQPALENMSRGVYSRVVKADLGFLLNKWPNHYPGLQALIKYDLAGGQDYPGDYTDIPTECYFARARRFVPDDYQVLLLEGYYFSQNGKKQRAVKAYQDALAISPQSPEANYLLGLLYFDLREFEKANECAQKAYAQDYPLPGLKTKLQKAGRWVPLPPQPVELTVPPAAVQPTAPPPGM